MPLIPQLLWKQTIQYVSWEYPFPHDALEQSFRKGASILHQWLLLHILNSVLSFVFINILSRFITWQWSIPQQMMLLMTLADFSRRSASMSNFHELSTSTSFVKMWHFDAIDSCSRSPASLWGRSLCMASQIESRFFQRPVIKLSKRSVHPESKDKLTSRMSRVHNSRLYQQTVLLFLGSVSLSLSLSRSYSYNSNSQSYFAAARMGGRERIGFNNGESQYRWV